MTKCRIKYKSMDVYENYIPWNTILLSFCDRKALKLIYIFDMITDF